ncbi:ABC transporter substrate-binding protein, partial [Streptomyces sp. SID10244]|nr:ABC transporter substrate-binding protein [Streptomyces sp. SID10244]
MAAACVFSVVSCSSDDDSSGGSTSAAGESGVKAAGQAIKVGLFNPSKGPATQAGVSSGK